MNMKTIDLANQTPSIEDLVQWASEGNIILRTAEGREFLLAEVEDLPFDQEVELVRQQSELMQFLDQRSRAGRTISLDEARKALGLDP